MATQISSKVREDIDWYLSSLEREVQWAVDLAMRWDEIDEIEQEDLVGEWSLVVDFLYRSMAYHDKGLMSHTQHQHLNAIATFLNEHRPVLAGVLGEENLMFSLSLERHVVS
jgi:hypothetical protein